MGEQIKNKIANLSNNFKYQLTIIWLLHTELKRESIQKGAQREQQMLEKEKEHSEEGGREYGLQLRPVWGKAQQKNFSTTFVRGCITSSLGLHYKVKNHI